MTIRPPIRHYHRFTIITIASLSTLMGITSGILPMWFAIMFLVLPPLIRNPVISPAVFRPIAIVLAVLNVGLAGLVGAFAYRETQDIVFLFGPLFSAIVTLALLFPLERKLDWKLCVGTLMLSVTAVIGGAEVVDHVLFILFCAAFVFYLNSSYFAEREPHERIPEGYFLPFVLCLAAGWSFGIFIFVFFPRTIQWSNPFGLRDRQSLTGYSGALSLTGSGPTPSSALALVVEPLDSGDQNWLAVNGQDLYFRGNVLDQFDGLKWHQTFTVAEPLELHRRGRPHTRLHGVKIYREPHSNPWIVYPGQLWNIDLPQRTTGRPLLDESGNVLRAIPGYFRYSYQIDFEETPLFYFGRAGELSEEEESSYTEVPTEFAEKPYFAKWLASLERPKANAALLESLQILAKHFQKNFKAVLASEAKSLEEFLTNRREGHCEYFATAATMALRSWGIPSRVVLGFRGGQFNRFSQVLEVRDQNAHAWVEVFTHQGWLRFDPTPLVRRIPSFAWIEEFELWTGAAKYWFSRYVVDYNTRTQTELILSLAKSNLVGNKKLHFDINWTWVFLTIALGASAIWWLQRRKGLFVWQRRGSQLPRYYLEFQGRLGRLGFYRRPCETFRAFHQRVKHPELRESIVEEVDRRLERDLYAV